MSEAKNDGGPAFPVSTGDPHKEYQDGPYTAQFPGMTLRDYFAAKAIGGLVVNGDNFNLPQLAAFSYEIADAMLKVRGAA